MWKLSQVRLESISQCFMTQEKPQLLVYTIVLELKSCFQKKHLHKDLASQLLVAAPVNL